MNKVLRVAAILEFATGLALIFVPTLVGQLLLGQEVTGVAVMVARVTGIALVGLAAACWPGPPLLGMLIYGTAVAIYLAIIGLSGFGGLLLWPAVAAHLVLSIALARAGLATRTDQ